MTDFNARNKNLTRKLLHQGCRHQKLRKAFSKFDRRHYELLSKFKVGLKSLFQQGAYRNRNFMMTWSIIEKNVSRADFSDQSRSGSTERTLIISVLG